MKRTVLGFSVRSDRTMPLDAMCVLVQEALGCTFREGDFHKVPALTTDLLGMKVVLFEWAGLKQTETFRLQGYIDDERFLDGWKKGEALEVVENDISPAIVDLLDVRKAGEWRIPSIAEIDAELEHGEALERRFHN